MKRAPFNQKELDKEEACSCGLKTGDLTRAICGHLVCKDCLILCENCAGEYICPGCAVRDGVGNRTCGECLV